MHIKIEDLIAGLVPPHTPSNTYVYLDGEYVHCCIEANEEEGYVVCYEKSPDGRFKVDVDWCPTTVQKEGVVEIKLKETE